MIAVLDYPASDLQQWFFLEIFILLQKISVQIFLGIGALKFVAV